MSEKGGKGHSQPNGGKSSLKSPTSLNGKDDGSAKSKRARKVQFDGEDDKVSSFPKSGGKGDNPFSKGNLGKGGKGDKTGNGGKSLPPLELRLEQELSENAKCMMDCEAADISQGIQYHMIVLSTDPTIKIPPSFDMALQYATRGNHFKNPESVKHALETLKEHGVADGEMCMIANTVPESVDEVFALVPSFKGKKKKLGDLGRCTTRTGEAQNTSIKTWQMNSCEGKLMKQTVKKHIEEGGMKNMALAPVSVTQPNCIPPFPRFSFM